MSERAVRAVWLGILVAALIAIFWESERFLTAMLAGILVAFAAWRLNGNGG